MLSNIFAYYINEQYLALVIKLFYLLSNVYLYAGYLVVEYFLVEWLVFLYLLRCKNEIT